MDFLKVYYRNRMTFKVSFFIYQAMHAFMRLITTFECLLYIRRWLLTFNGKQNMGPILMELEV